MEPISYSQVEEIVQKLPKNKLSRAYKLLSELFDDKGDMSSPQLDFLSLPIEERRRLMEQQSHQMVEHYLKTAEERQDLQVGDFIDDYKTE